MTRRILCKAGLAFAGGMATTAQVRPTGVEIAGKRKASIQKTIAGIEAELKAHGGDWSKWVDELAAFRKALLDVHAWEEKQNVRTSTADPKFKTALLKAEGTPPLFVEPYTTGYVAPMLSPEHDHQAWAGSLISPGMVRATAAWLRKKGIDLIFVPVPKMIDIYGDRVAKMALPADGIASPHLRKVFLDLLKADIEMVDLLPKMLEARSKGSEPLTIPADVHWSDTGRIICVDEVAAVLRRYPEVQRAMKSAPQFSITAELNTPVLSLAPLLNPTELTAIQQFLHTPHEIVRRKNGELYGTFETGQFMVMGDSFATIGPQLAHRINLPVTTTQVPGGTVQPVKELLRDPMALEGVKAIIWVVNYAIFFLHDWSGMPQVVMKEMTAARPAQ